MRAFEPDEFSSGSSFTDAELIFLRGRSEKSPRPTGKAGRYDGKKKGAAAPFLLPPKKRPVLRSMAKRPANGQLPFSALDAPQDTWTFAPEGCTIKLFLREVLLKKE